MTARVPEAVAFAVGPEVDESRLSRWVPGLSVAGPATASDRTLLDTFDGRLYRRGLVLWESRDGSATLEGFPGSIPLRPARTAKAAQPAPVRAGDLPAGPAGDRLRDAVGERALLPSVRVRGTTVALKICDAEAQSVVRLYLVSATAVRRRSPPRQLRRRLEVHPVLGYGGHFDRVVAALARRLERCPSTLAEEAMSAAGVDPNGSAADPPVPLTASMRSGKATLLICRSQARTVDANLPGTIADIDTEFLHDLRVAVRRTRSVLKEMRKVLPPDVCATARADLRWIQEITGPTRDLDVALHSWPDLTEPVPERMVADLEPLLALLRRDRDSAWSTMRRQLRSRRFGEAWGRWRSVVDGGAFDGPDARKPVGELAGARIVSVYRTMAETGSAIDDSSPPEALHDLRKKGKELRYLLELFGSAWPAERVKPLVSALKGLQDELGHYQDDEVQVRELRSLGPALAATPGGTDSLIALGFVIEGLDARQKQARAEFSDRFGEFASTATRKLVASTFGASR